MAITPFKVTNFGTIRKPLWDSTSDSVLTCSQKAKNQKAKQTIMHCTTKQYNTRQEIKCSAKQWTKESDIGPLVFSEGVMNERFVAVSTVTGSRICGLAFLSRDMVSVSRRGGNRWWLQLDKLSNLRKKITSKCVAPIWKRRKLSILQRHPVWHKHCHWINNANRLPPDRLNRFCLIFPQAMVPNNCCAVFKNWSETFY